MMPVMQWEKSAPATKIADLALSSNEATEDSLMDWLRSDACTLEAAGCESTGFPVSSESFEEHSLQDSELYSGPGRWPPPEVLQLEHASAAGDFFAVQTILHQWNEKPKCEQINKDLFASCFEFTLDKGRLPIAQHLVEHGIVINEAHFKLAMNKKCYAFLQLALDYGLDINKSWGDYDVAPLADTFDDKAMTRWFLDHGADPNAQTRLGITPISKALVSASFDIVTLLFDQGGPDSIQHGHLLHHIIHRQNQDRLQVLEYLFAKGALNQLNRIKYHDCPSLYEEENLIVGCGTPLHEAATSGKLDIVRSLVARGADPLMHDGKGRLPIDLARTACHTGVVDFLASLSLEIN